MKTIVCWFDVVSPYAWLAFQRLPQALKGQSYAVEYRPVLLGALLSHWGQLGPAELAPKRDWTYRQVHWLADSLGVPFEMPAVHPFNPLALLRLAVACTPAGGTPNRRVVEALLQHVWTSGDDPNDPARVAELAARLAPAREPAAPDVKDELRRSTEAAIAAGVFGVPSFGLDGRLFWGLDSLPMLAAALRGDPWFDTRWQAAAAPRPGVRRS